MSVNVTPLTVTGFAAGLDMTTASVEGLLLAITAGVKDFAIAGAAAADPVADALVVVKDKPCVCPL